MQKFHFVFQNSGELEYNDIVYDKVFDLLNNEFILKVSPVNSTLYWRLGIRLSNTPNIEFYHPTGRHVNKSSPDIHIAVGEWDRKIWSLPNRFQLAQYYLDNIPNHILYRSESYSSFKPCEWRIRLLEQQGEGRALSLSCDIEGCEPFAQLFAISEEYKYFQVFAWADKSPFTLDVSVTQRSYAPVYQENIIFRMGDMFDNDVITSSDIILLPAAGTGTATDNILDRARELDIPAPSSKTAGQIETFEVNATIGKRLRAGYAYTFENGTSNIEIIRSICLNIVRNFSNEGNITINIPLFGTGGGNLDPISIANVYDDIFNVSPNIFRIIVSILNADFFEKIKDYFENSPFDNPISNSPDIRSRLHSDNFSLEDEDVLNYDLIAENFFTILCDRETNPPLNVGVIAPWGRGKTNLMKRLKNKFDEKRKSLMLGKESLEKSPSLKKVLNEWLKIDWSKQLESNVPYATVWFNPWNYQGTDLVWAGLADAIIEQVADSIPGRIEKEIFWFKLRLARINKSELRRDLQTRFLLYSSSILFSLLILVLTTGYFMMFKPAIAWTIFSGGGVLAFTISILSRLKPYKTNIAKAFDKYTKPPKYSENLGTFHEVETDVHRVLNLYIDEKKPLIIFVDDLDRCSASKVVEVIEAINVFISGTYNNKCYFILGMDAEMVAAALDVTYEKMKGMFGEREAQHGSVGWYFLDKFIQLPFFIPIMSESKKEEYLGLLIKEKIELQEEEITLDVQKVEKVFKNVMATNDNKISSDIIISSKLSLTEKNQLDKMILQKQVESKGQEEEIRIQILTYCQFISSDPRSLKRFANLMRFYCSYQFLRMKKDQQFANVKVLAKWLVIMIKFPQFVRWIQWDADNKNGNNISSEKKAKILDKLIQDYHNKYTDTNKKFSNWLQMPLPEIFFCSEVKKIVGNAEHSWIKSENMYDILMFQFSNENKFANAFSCNVW